MDANEVDELREALRRADMALAGLRNTLVVERELQARCAELERERDEALANLARYTAVYGDPDAPVEPPAPDLDMGTPLLPGLADLILAAPQIKVGDHVRCECLGNLTGIVETVNPSDKPGWDQCLVRDDREGHVWGAAAWVLEVGDER